MRRAFAIFFLLLLPLQSVWAAAGAYCQHESGSQAQHFGHHDHQHQTSHDQDNADTKLPGGFDSDCGACHAGCVVAILGDIAGVNPPHLLSETLYCSLAGHSLSPLDIPERPNWAALA